MAHTGGLFIVSVPLAVARGSRTEAGASEDIEKRRTDCTRRATNKSSLGYAGPLHRMSKGEVRR